MSIAVVLAVVGGTFQDSPPAARAGPDSTGSWGASMTPPAASGRSASILFGTLGSMSSRAAQENAAGVRGATVELNWGAYEPTQGQFSSSYVAEITAQVRAFRDAGQQLTLALGIHYTPQWVRSLPDAVAVDQYGARRPGVDMVFSQPVRDAVSAYLARIDRDLGVENFAYIRLTSGGNAEMLYNTTGSYAAFSAAAQNGSNLARGMAPNPSPGWKPGQRNVSSAQVRRWGDWYVSALGNVTRWQMGEFGRLGFQGVYQAITPGSGVRPYQYDKAVQEFLPDGLVGIGGVWQAYYAGLAGAGRIMVYVSSVADGSAGDNTCYPSDLQARVIGTTPYTWSATRWQSRLAAEYGFSVGGENPGYGDGRAVEPFYSDTTRDGMITIALRQAVRCGFGVFNFAHDMQLWDGPYSLSAYAGAIRALG